MNSWVMIACLLLLAFLVGLIFRFLFNRFTASGSGLGRLRGWLVPVVIIWAVLSAWWYVCKIKHECGDLPTVSAEAPEVEITPPAAKVEVPDVIVSQPQWPLFFNWNSQIPSFGSGFDSFRGKLLTDLKPGHLLKIVGLYHPNEANKSDFSNLGLARAENIKNALSPYLDTSRIQVAGAAISGSPKVDQPYEAFRFETLAPPPPPLKKISKKQSIHFPLSSDQIIWDTQLKTYFDDVATRVATSGEHLYLTGFTDNTGNAAANDVLSERRVQSVKQALVKRGVKSTLISTESQGEAQPVSSNDTQTGRRNNRRVELEIR